jgi:hypothetical protein
VAEGKGEIKGMFVKRKRFLQFRGRWPEVEREGWRREIDETADER